MKRSRKTVFALLLALVMTLGLAATVWATEGDSGIVGVPLPDGPVINQPTPEVPEAYKIPFTKVVEQAGTCAPGKETFTFEAFNPNDEVGAYPDVRRSVEIETNGAGTYQGTLTITGPAEQVERFVDRGFYVREVKGDLSGWTYSNEVWYVSREGEIFPAMMGTTDNGDFYDVINNADAEGKMTFENIYTENLATVEIPFTKTVKLGGNTAPGTTEFKLAIFNIGNGSADGYKDVTYTAAVTTNGAGSYDGKLVISGPAAQIRDFVSEGFYVREMNDNLSGWTYSDAVWHVMPENQVEIGVPPMKIYPTKLEKTPNGEFYVDGETPVDKMTFENIYTRNTSYTTPDVKPTSSPKTFDAGVALYGVSALLSLTGTALVIKRKNG